MTSLPFTSPETKYNIYHQPDSFSVHPSFCKPLHIIVACKQDRGIGKKNTIPWNLPADIQHFKHITTQTAYEGKRNALIMGRKTYESIPLTSRPLKDRLNIVLSSRPFYLASSSCSSCSSCSSSSSSSSSPSPPSSPSSPPTTIHCRSFEEALDQASQDPSVESIFVIGGSSLYNEALKSPHCTTIHLTSIYGVTQPCDVYFGEIDPTEYELTNSSPPQTYYSLKYQFLTFTRKTRLHEEQQYLDLVRRILDQKLYKMDRTGKGTLSVFGAQMRFSLRNNILPLLTTKRVFWKGVVEELLWFISGSTNAKILHDKGVCIWDKNASRQFLDSRGLTDREEWDLGPVYGFQWRHFGAKYVSMHSDYKGQGVDQLAACIDKIKNDPSNRRIVMSAWNPPDLPNMALPPCHLLVQFSVQNNELSCSMYQRSCDMGLGVPFNIASYSLLTKMVAQVCGLEAGELIYTLGDAHVYMDHVEPLEAQLKRFPRPFPTLRIDPSVKDIDSFQAKHFVLENYNPHRKIQMNLSV